MRIFLITKERINELPAVKGLQVFYAFAKTDVAYRNMELVTDTDNNTAFGRSVKLRYGHTCDVSCRGELPGLLKSILPGTAVKNEHDIVGRIWKNLLNDALYL